MLNVVVVFQTRKREYFSPLQPPSIRARKNKKPSETVVDRSPGYFGYSREVCAAAVADDDDEDCRRSCSSSSDIANINSRAMF